MAEPPESPPPSWQPASDDQRYLKRRLRNYAWRQWHLDHAGEASNGSPVPDLPPALFTAPPPSASIDGMGEHSVSPAAADLCVRDRRPRTVSLVVSPLSAPATTPLAKSSSRRLPLAIDTHVSEESTSPPRHPQSARPAFTNAATPLSAQVLPAEPSSAPLFSWRRAVDALKRAPQSALSSMSLFSQRPPPSATSATAPAGSHDAVACFGDHRTLFNKPASFDGLYLREHVRTKPSSRRQTWLLLAKYSQSIYKSSPFEMSECLDAIRAADDTIDIFLKDSDTIWQARRHQFERAREAGPVRRTASTTSLRSSASADVDPPAPRRNNNNFFFSLFGTPPSPHVATSRQAVTSRLIAASTSPTAALWPFMPQTSSGSLIPAPPTPVIASHTSSSRLSASLHETCDQIERDVQRTHVGPATEPRGRRRLMRLLLAHAMWNTDIGYCQSISMLAGLLLLGMEAPDARPSRPAGTLDESASAPLPQAQERAIPARTASTGMPGDESSDAELDADSETLLVLRTIVDVYLPRDYYVNLFGLIAEFETLMVLVERILPDLDAHAKALTKHGEPYPLKPFMQRWLMTFFADVLKPACALLVLDAFLCDGLQALHRIALALLKANRKGLLETDDWCDFSALAQTACTDLHKGGMKAIEALLVDAYRLDRFPSSEEYQRIRSDQHALSAKLAEEHGHAHL